MGDMPVERDLSAYLDGELAPAERALVDTHLAGCRPCAGRLSELRATASLIRALPSARPSRSLVPRVGGTWAWLRPVRSFSMFASGAFLFVFLLTAVSRSGAGLGGAGAPTAAQAPAPASSVARDGAGAAQATPAATPAPPA